MKGSHELVHLPKASEPNGNGENLLGYVDKIL
jgi:hypothetical protein